MKQVRHLLLFLAASTLIWPLSFDRACADEALPPPKQFNVGVLTDLSGKGAYLGNQSRVGALLAEQDLGRDGGVPVTFSVEDHGLDPTKAATAAQKLLAVEKVDALVSTFSGPSRAANPIAANAHKSFVYLAAAVEPLAKNDFAFKSYLDYVQGCEVVARQWKARGVTRIGVLKAEAEFGELCLEGVKRVYADPILASYKPGEALSSQVLMLKGKRAEAILNAGYEGDMESLLKSLRELRYPVPVGANEDIFTPKLVTGYGSELEGATAFGMPKAPESLAARVRAADPSITSASLDQAAMTYLHCLQLGRALRRCYGSGPECVRDQLLREAAAPEFGFTGWRADRQAGFNWTASLCHAGTFAPVVR